MTDPPLPRRLHVHAFQRPPDQLRLLLDLQERRGLSMLYITHDIATARKISDRIAVMLDGQIIEEGPSYEIVASPSHEYTKRLLESAAALNHP